MSVAWATGAHFRNFLKQPHIFEILIFFVGIWVATTFRGRPLRRASPMRNVATFLAMARAAGSREECGDRTFLNGFLTHQGVSFKSVDDGGGFHGEGRSPSERLGPGGGEAGSSGQR